MNKKEITTPAEPATPAAPALSALPAEPSMPESVKPGYETSEFWITLVSTIVPNLITLLAIFKIVPNEIASTLSTSLVAVIGGIITIIVALKYIKSRTAVKIRSLELGEAARSRRFDIQSTRMSIFIQLLDRGVVNKEALKKEFSVI